LAVDRSLLAKLACPYDGLQLQDRGATLVCSNAHDWPVVDEIPVFLRPELETNGSRIVAESLALAAAPPPDTFDGVGVHPQVQAMVASTGGFMYANLKLVKYPIPTLRWAPGEGRSLLDVGCNWGRWTIAAARAGYRAVGLDPHLASLRAAKHVAKAAGVEAQFVCGDARAMPFQSDTFQRTFSYSVVQHFSKADARTILSEIARVLELAGESLIQMPNRKGARSIYHLARRGFREGARFEVRYYSCEEILNTFGAIIGPSTLSIDGFFGLGIQPDDLPIMPLSRRLVIHASEFLRTLSGTHSRLREYADSVYVTSSKTGLVESRTVRG
jgi:SAM-dependent methyltransferase/uncharacterized protein YbaR (Trm112 family)